MTELTPREQKQVLDYLAITHLAGQRPRKMHLGSNWSIYVLLGTQFHEGRLEVKCDHLMQVLDHVMVKTADKLKAQGFRVLSLEHKFWNRWTIRRGIPMRHDVGREVRIFRDGDCFQVQDEERNFAWVQLYKKGEPL